MSTPIQDNDKIEVGLDIGTTKICAIAGKRNEYGKLEIMGMGKAVSDGVTRGMVTNIDKTVESIKQAIKQLEDNTGLDVGEVNIGIAGQHIRSSKHQGMIMRPNPQEVITVQDVYRLTEEMNKIVIPPGSNIIHIMPQMYTIDYEQTTNEPVGMVGARLEAEFHIITSQTSAINNIKHCVKKAGAELGKKEFNLKQLILEPVASSMAVLTNEEKEAGVALIDIGGGTTDIAIFQDNIIRHTAVIPFGGNIITQDIKQGCGLLHHQAEKLKTQFGCALANETPANHVIAIQTLAGREPKEISIRTLAQIIQSRMDEIIQLAYAELKTSGYYKNLSGGIVITGGGAMLKYVKQLFEYNTAMDTRLGIPHEHLGKSKIEDIKNPVYSTCIGLVLAGFQSYDMRDNKYEELKSKSKTGIDASQKAIGKDGDVNNAMFLKNLNEKIKNFFLEDNNDKYDYQ
ncbi:MAG: cell division protein FtsA [Cytophagales bacterium]|nr:cell division protein FtsA [Cytophagales bacterium]